MPNLERALESALPKETFSSGRIESQVSSEEIRIRRKEQPKRPPSNWATRWAKIKKIVDQLDTCVTKYVEAREAAEQCFLLYEPIAMLKARQEDHDIRRLMIRQIWNIYQEIGDKAYHGDIELWHKRIDPLSPKVATSVDRYQGYWRQFFEPALNALYSEDLTDHEAIKQAISSLDKGVTGLQRYSKEICKGLLDSIDQLVDSLNELLGRRETGGEEM
ncbi:MAG: hypothetical protein RML36_01675 [Anaerolineae bacterium]|nr:hypothetical protein [Anaerolineae bacterium]MDW8098176.1 hypothetical protein [Anaerolineae bacterium]